MTATDAGEQRTRAGSANGSSGREWPARVDAVIFDCDGLLLDTAAAWEHAFETAASSRGWDLSRAELAQLQGTSVEEAARLLGRVLAVDPAELAEELHGLLIGSPHDPIPYPGAERLLADLHGTYRLAVASNAPPGVLRGHLDRAGLLDRFDVVVAASETGLSKPAGDVYRAACRRLGVPSSHAIAIEDSVVGVVAARAAGLFVVGIPAEGGAAPPADLVLGGLHELTQARRLG